MTWLADFHAVVAAVSEAGSPPLVMARYRGCRYATDDEPEDSIAAAWSPPFPLELLGKAREVTGVDASIVMAAFSLDADTTGVISVYAADPEVHP